MHKREFRQLICAMLLGDGCIYIGRQKTGSKKWSSLDRAFYCMNHGSNQEDYAVWKAELINDIFRKKDIPRRCTFSKSTKFDKKRKKTYKGIYVKLSWSKYFRHLRKWTYKNKQKDVQYLLKQCTKDIHMAIYFMDDGTEVRYRSRDKSKFYRPYYKLCSYAYTKGENQLMKEWFEQKYNISPAIGHDDARQDNISERYFLRFSCDDSEKLFNIFKPYFEQMESMKQKFWLSFKFYVEKQAPSGDYIVQTTTP